MSPGGMPSSNSPADCDGRFIERRLIGRPHHRQRIVDDQDVLPAIAGPEPARMDQRARQCQDQAQNGQRPQQQAAAIPAAGGRSSVGGRPRPGTASPPIRSRRGAGDRTDAAEPARRPAATPNRNVRPRKLTIQALLAMRLRKNQPSNVGQVVIRRHPHVVASQSGHDFFQAVQMLPHLFQILVANRRADPD